jgi:hypothetical protein
MASNTKITLTYCGMEGAGETVRAARQNAADKLTSIMNANYSPHVVSCGDMKALIYNTPSGVVVVPIYPGPQMACAGYTCTNEGIDEAIESQAMHQATQTADNPGQRPEIHGYRPTEAFWREFDWRMEQYEAARQSA